MLSIGVSSDCVPKSEPLYRPEDCGRINGGKVTSVRTEYHADVLCSRLSYRRERARRVDAALELRDGAVSACVRVGRIRRGHHRWDVRGHRRRWRRHRRWRRERGSLRNRRAVRRWHFGKRRRGRRPPRGRLSGIPRGLLVVVVVIELAGRRLTDGLGRVVEVRPTCVALGR